MILINKSELLDHVKYMSEIKTDQLKEVIDRLLTVDIVRCKDCKWYGHLGCAIRIVDDSDKPNDNDFCSFGERSE